MKNIIRVSFLACLLSVASFAQLYTLSTATITSAITANVTRFAVSSVTGMTVESASAGTAGSMLYAMDEQGPGEAMVVTYIDTVNLIVGVRRGQAGTKAVAHLALANMYFGAQNLFYATDQQGSCTLNTTLVTPAINVLSGYFSTCVNGRWVVNSDAVFFVPATSCTSYGTGATATNTYVPVGASDVLVLNASLASAGSSPTVTLVCDFTPPTNVTAFRGAIITDITLLAGSITTVPAAVGTATLGTITFPVASTSMTASTVAPVAIGGTVTTAGIGVAATSGFLTAVTTAGSFYSLKSTFSTVVDLSTDLRMLQYTIPFTETSSNVTVIQTPGLLVHYTRQR